MADEHVSRACDRWKTSATTDSLEGTEGVVDHYSRDIDLPPGQDADAVFRHLEERLLSYEIPRRG